MANSTFSGPVRSENGFGVKTGGTAPMAGVATLVAGTVTIPTTAVTANSHIHYSRQAVGGTPGHLRASKVAGTSITIASSDALDTSTVAWEIREPFTA